MSLLSPETLNLFVSPGAVLALNRVGWRRELGRTHSYPVGDATPGTPWQPLLGACALALKDFGCKRARVLLSHHYVQYRVLPWRDDLVGDEEYQALAQLEFSAAFASLADDWTIRLSDEAPGLPRLAAALPSSLLATLVAAAADAGVALDAVQPYLAAATGLWERETARGLHWLLLHEPGRITAAVKDDGGWCWLRSVRVGDDWVHELPRLLQAEALLSGWDTDSHPVRVFAPGADARARAELQAMGLVLLAPADERGFSMNRDGVFAPAWMA